MGNSVKGIACGGRHSAVVTDAGVLLTFGWGSYGQCGQGNTDDSLRPTCVSFPLGTDQIEAVAAGFWHSVCICADGRVHAFGGNQFGQQSEMMVKFLAGAGINTARSISSPVATKNSTFLRKLRVAGGIHSHCVSRPCKIFHAVAP